MANIQVYLSQLEARLAPSLDAQSLRERLTEAEVHLRDRAQEFEEIGLPPLEAEARAVAAFGDPEEFAENAPIKAERSEDTPKTRLTAKSGRDLGLQLACSAVGLGLVSMLTSDCSAWIAGGFAVAFLALGALFGRPTPILRMGLLAGLASLVACPVLFGFYEPMPSNAIDREQFGVHLRGSTTAVDRAFREARLELDRFDRARANCVKDGKELKGSGNLFLQSGSDQQVGEINLENGAYTDLGKVDIQNVGPASGYEDHLYEWLNQRYWPHPQSLETYATREQAEHRWKRDGDAVRAQLVDAVSQSKPITSQLTSWQCEGRFALVALAGGVLLLAAMVGAQALALALRGFFGWAFSPLRRKPEDRARSYYGEPERS